jgi:hypothetical protein
MLKRKTIASDRTITSESDILPISFRNRFKLDCREFAHYSSQCLFYEAFGLEGFVLRFQGSNAKTAFSRGTIIKH